MIELIDERAYSLLSIPFFKVTPRLFPTPNSLLSTFYSLLSNQEVSY
jgi:hypothetical protein